MLVAALVVVLVAASPSFAAKGKPKLKARTFSSGALNQPIPDAPPGGVGILRSPINVPAKYKGLEVKDANVSVSVRHDDVEDLKVGLIAPDGAGMTLVNFAGGTSLGSGQGGCAGKPLTLDDQTPFQLTPFGPPGPLELGPPYAGRAQTQGEPLRTATGSAVAGRWRLVVIDTLGGFPGTLDCWGIKLLPRRPR